MQPPRPIPPAATDDERLRMIITQVSDGILVVNQDGLVRYANPAAAKMLDRPADELFDQPFGFPIVSTVSTEIEVLHHNSAYRVVEMRAMPTYWADEPAYVVALHDVTVYRRAEEVLRDADAFNWAILNALGNHIAVLDHLGTIVAVNDAWRAFARSNGDPELQATDVGTNYFTVCHTSSSDEVLQGLHAVLNGQQDSFFLEYPCHSPTAERWYEMRAVPFKGRPKLGLVVSHTEITDRKEATRIAAEARSMHERLIEQEREIDALRRLSQPDPLPSGSREMLPLRQRIPLTFSTSVDAYGDLLDHALQRRAFDNVHEPLVTPNILARRLGDAVATPRDVVEMHLEALHARTRNTKPARAQAYLEEGRVLALEVMGHLAGYYRSRTLGITERGVL